MEQERTNSTQINQVPHTVTSSESQPVFNRANVTSTNFSMIRHISAYVTIASAILFALISVLAIWNVFGENTGDVVWRAASSLGVIGFASLVVSVVSRSMEDRSR